MIKELKHVQYNVVEEYIVQGYAVVCWNMLCIVVYWNIGTCCALLCVGTCVLWNMCVGRVVVG